jgi:hypothetical protein
MPGAKEFLRTKKENTILKMQNRFSSSAAFGVLHYHPRR